MEELAHIIYVSFGVRKFSDTELEEMLQSFRANNEKLDVTGMLLYDNHYFFQILEGDYTVISKLYTEIEKDPRHHSVKIIIDEPIEARDFDNWSMGYAKVNSELLNTVMGENDFFTEHKCLERVNPGFAKNLLEYYSVKHGL